MALLVPDDLWLAIEPLLPPERPKPKGGRPRAADRAALAGILFVLRTAGQASCRQGPRPPPLPPGMPGPRDQAAHRTPRRGGQCSSGAAPMGGGAQLRVAGPVPAPERALRLSSEADRACRPPPRPPPCSPAPSSACAKSDSFVLSSKYPILAEPICRQPRCRCSG